MLQEILDGLKADGKMQTGRHNQATHNNDKVQGGLDAWQVLRLDMRCPHSQPGGIPKEREEKTPKPHWQWKCEFIKKTCTKDLAQLILPLAVVAHFLLRGMACRDANATILIYYSTSSS